MNLDGQFFNQIVVLVVAHIQVFAVFSQHAFSPKVKSIHEIVTSEFKSIKGVPRRDGASR